MIELVYEQKQVGMWNKLPWNTSCGIGVRWEVLIRQAYWQWSTHRETTKRCDLVGLLSCAVAMTGIAVPAACFPVLWSSGAKRDILRGCDNPKVVVEELFRGGATSHRWCRCCWRLRRGKAPGQAPSAWTRCPRLWQVWGACWKGDWGEGFGRGLTDRRLKMAGTEASRG